MTVYIVHSLKSLMSVVQVFVGDKMSFVAHLVKADTVGSDKHLGINFKVRQIVGKGFAFPTLWSASAQIAFLFPI